MTCSTRRSKGSMPLSRLYVNNYLRQDTSQRARRTPGRDRPHVGRVASGGGVMEKLSITPNVAQQVGLKFPEGKSCSPPGRRTPTPSPVSPRRTDRPAACDHAMRTVQAALHRLHRGCGRRARSGVQPTVAVLLAGVHQVSHSGHERIAAIFATHSRVHRRFASCRRATEVLVGYKTRRIRQQESALPGLLHSGHTTQERLLL
jgi:hypothetical protein